MRPPETSLAPSSEPWGRWLNEAAAGVRGSLDREAQNQNSTGSQFNARMDQMARNLNRTDAIRIQRIDTGPLYQHVSGGTGTYFASWDFNVNAQSPEDRIYYNTIVTRATMPPSGMAPPARIPAVTPRVWVNGDLTTTAGVNTNTPNNQDGVGSTIGFSEMRNFNVVTVGFAIPLNPMVTRDVGWDNLEITIVWNERVS